MGDARPKPNPAKHSLPHTDLIEQSVCLLAAVRAKRPRIHCITNAAAQVFTANLLLAAGAIPSLTFAAEEVPFFTRRSAALLINLGTLDAERRAAIPAAIAAAQEARLPWVLDPVFVEASPPRLALALALLTERPAVIRCNATEFAALSGGPVSAEALAQFSADHHGVVALTGAVDHIVQGGRMAALANGHPLMSQTTAMGCAGTALLAAFATVHDDAFTAAAAALLVLGVTGELAAQRAQGPGSFVPAFLDALSALTGDNLRSLARMEP